MTMTLADLMEKLEDIAAEHGTDVEVRLAHQPRWAFEYSIDTVAAARVREDGGPKQTVVYIAEGGQVGYLPGAAAAAVGWGRDRDDDDEDDDDDDEDAQAERVNALKGGGR